MTGIVITGGGSLIKNLKQLVAYVSGKETRIGYPNEHLGPESKDVVVSPIYSTGVGLVLKGFEYMEQHPEKFVMPEDSPSDVEEGEPEGSEITKEQTLLDRISGWFTEDIH